MADVTLLADLNIPGNLLIDDGVLYLNGFNVTCGTMELNDTIAVQGSETITVGGSALELSTNPNVTLGAAWTMEFRGAGSVIVQDYSVTMFNIIFGLGKTHVFTSGLSNQVIINGQMDSNGTVASRSILESSTPTQEWFIKLDGTSNLFDGLDVADSNAENGIDICASLSLDNGNNTNWSFDRYCHFAPVGIDPIDHLETAESRIITEYRETVNLIGYIKALLVEADNIEFHSFDMLDKRNIDNAFGETLDILGSLVGRSRSVLTSSELDFFGFLGAFNSGTFGTIADPFIGEVFKSASDADDGSRLLSDEEYRVYIRSAIMKNNTNATPENIISIIQFLFNTTSVEYTETTGGYKIEIFDILTVSEQKIIVESKVIPKTIGFEVEYVFA